MIYLKNNPEAIDCLKILLLENIEYPAVNVLYESIRDFEDDLEVLNEHIKHSQF
jgi:hypothetical protein